MPENDKTTPQVDPARPAPGSYPANNKQAKENGAETEKKIEKIEGITAVKTGPSFSTRLRQSFVGDDRRGLGDYLIFDIIVPAFKNTLFDLITGGANRALYGAARPNVQPGNSSLGRVNYNQISKVIVGPGQQPIQPGSKSSSSYEDLLLPSRQQADLVLSRLDDVIGQYNMATVTDLYELVGVTGNFVDDMWGWFDLRGADIRPARGGFLLQLPPIKPIR